MMGRSRRYTAPVVVWALFAGVANAQQIERQIYLTEPDAMNGQSQAAVFGSRAVWVNVATVGDRVIQDIQTRTIGTVLGPISSLTHGSLGEQNFAPDIDGPNIVWSHTSPLEEGDVMLFIVRDPIETSDPPYPIAASLFGPYMYEQPAVSGRYVPYVRVTPDARRIIDLYDIQSGFLVTVTSESDPNDMARPRVSGTTIVYESYPDFYNVEVWSYTPATGNFPIATRPLLHPTPDVDGDFVVYVEYDNTNPLVRQIVSYRLSDQTQTVITSAASVKIAPRVVGNLVVWMDNRLGPFKIFGYDLVGQREWQINPSPSEGEQAAPDVDHAGDNTRYNVVYTVDRRRISLVTLRLDEP